MTTFEGLTGTRLRAALGAAEQWLALNRDAVNAINVYPVPDGDTGTNMLLTLRAGLAAADHAPVDTTASIGALTSCLSRATLLGARGNSGVILSQMVRGLAEGLAGLDMAGPGEIVRALQHASDVAYAAVSDPVEGTMLTVMREAARGAADASPRSVLEVFEAAQAAAEVALAKTQEQLPRLREAGVVDAGGMGIAVLLAGVRMGLAGEALPRTAVAVGAAPDVTALAHSGYGYCTEYVVQALQLDREALIANLEAIGADSVLVVGDPTMLHVHAHLVDPGPAISAGAALGALSAVKVENMQAQHEAWTAGRAAPAPEPADGLGLVAVARGDGIAAAFRGLGAVVSMPPDGVRPSAGELLEAARRTGRQKVLLLPNDNDVRMTAEQAASASDGLITVVPTGTVAAGLSAAMAFNPTDPLDRAREAMTAAGAGVRCLEVTRAAHTRNVDGISVREGEPIALLDGRVVACAGSLDEALEAGIEVAIGDAPAELLTVYLGSNAPIGAEEFVVERLARAYPGLSVEVVQGGQPHYPYIVGVE